ncbi:NUDIX hydrolase [Cupriavidus agavae]|uniref:NUDIX domain-containing protein n=1 Tax=Cupriavidus agavae TaxID=1001822 RepID=A0A4Q7S5P4_9BURK|nr:NUDIX hydrolase family protein [Cupriavidus agavae]RZT41696.1 NUDIX domain-containing protein [Cupriavidus agavae]
MSESDSRTSRTSKILAGIAARSPFDPAAHLRLTVEGAQVGWLPRRHAAILAGMGGMVGPQGQGAVALLPGCADTPARNVALAGLARQLADMGHVRGWRDELFAVTPALDALPYGVIERAAARFLGLLTFASHMNGIVEGATPALWISRRSPAKAVDPGMWDNLVAGGVPAGSDPLETLVRECDEESGIPPALAARAEAHGVIDVLREIPEGVQWERVYAYDLLLPADFVPHNRDGEVAEHRHTGPAALLDIMAARAMTVDATLVTLDALRRRGWADVQP